MEFTAHCPSPLGDLTLTSDGTALTGLYFDRAPEGASAELPVFDLTRRWLALYFCGKCPGFSVPLALRGTPFQRSVWAILETIPYGQTMTYGEIANLLALQMGCGKMSARAVGGAVGRNPVSILVPCHRVLGAKGSLTGYSGGMDRKIALLKLEGVDTGKFSVPGKKPLQNCDVRDIIP